MTVSNTDSSITYTGNGATTVFPYAFLIPTSGDAQVVVYDSVTLTETTLTVGVDCTITGTGDPAGGNVTYNPSGVPIPATTTITIRRELALTQTLDLTRQSNFDPTSLEAALDRAIMIIQQLNTRIEEDALLIPVGSSLSLDDLLAASAAASDAAIAALASQTAANASAVAAAASAAAAATFNPASYAALAGATFTGPTAGLTRASGDNTTNFATTAFVQTAIAYNTNAANVFLWSKFGGL